MKYAAHKPLSVLIVIQRMLAGILILIILMILAGTVYGIIFKPDKRAAVSNSIQPNNPQSDNRIFTGMGRIRTKSAEPESAAVIITIAFPYNPNDTSFSEELVSKISQFRNETVQYFQSHTTDELRLKTDKELHRELLVRYNALLRLGFIDTLYITDYMILR